MKRHRSVSPCASLHLRRHGDLDRDLWRALGAWHADRYFSEYQHPGHFRNMAIPACRRAMANRCRAPPNARIDLSVNSIEISSSESLPGYGIVKVFFQPTVNINAAEAQVTSISQTVLKQLPRHHPAVLAGLLRRFKRFRSSNWRCRATPSRTCVVHLATNFIRPALATIPGVQLPNPYGGAARQVQIDLDQNALRAHSLSATDIGNALARQNLITLVYVKIGS